MRSLHDLRRRCLGVAGFVAALAGGGGAVLAAEPRDPDELRRELDALSRELAALEPALLAAARLVPIEPEIPALEARLRRFAEMAGVEVDFRTLDHGETPALPDGSPGPLRLDRVELSGHGELWRIGALLSHIEAGALRLLDLESLELTAGDGSARFTARLLCPTWSGSADVAAAPAGDPRSLVAERRAEVARLRHRVAALDAWVARTSDGRLGATADLLDALGSVERTQITALRLGDRVELAGATVGATARQALAGAIENAGFAVSAAATPASGACRPFHFALSPPSRTARWFAPVATGVDPDPEAVALCATEPEPRAGALTSSGDPARPGTFALQARGLGLVDLFRVLHEVTGVGFAVAPDVRGTVDVDFEGVTLEEALATLAPLGLMVSEGPIHLVTRGRPSAPRADDWSGEPVTFAFARLPVADLLCFVRDAFGLESRIEPGLDAAISIFVRDQPWDLLLVRALESAGLSYALVGIVAHVAPPDRLGAALGSWPSACEVAAASQALSVSRLSAAAVGLEDLEPADLGLVAIVEPHGGEPRAWTSAAFSRLLELVPGAAVQGGTLASVTRNGVEIRLAGGASIRLVLPD